MKVIEIIDESLLGGLAKLGKMAAGSSAKAASKVLSKTAPTAMPKTINTAKLAKSDRNALAQLLRQGRKADAADVKALMSQIKNVQLQQNADSIVKLATTLNIMQEAAFYYVRAGELDDQLAAGEISPQEHQAQITALRGKFIFGVVGPKIAYMIAKPARMIGNMIPGTMKIVGFKNAAEFTKIVSSTAAKTALTAFFATDKGKEAVNNFFGGYITGFFEMAAESAAAIFNVAKAAYDEATGKPMPGAAPGAEKPDSTDDLSDILLGKGSGDLYQKVGRKPGL